MYGRCLWHLGSLVFLVLLAVCGILFFTRGFLLKRVELPHKSYCSQKITDGAQCYSDLAPKFQRAVIVLVDALKYEFLLHNPDLRYAETKPYENKLPIVRQVVKNHPGNAAVFKFIADPPTTTMQRIKGLTTGSLPTFIDISMNFAATSVAEDNIIDQFRAMGKNVTFMGDDTWMNLYPSSFTKAFPFPSFDVKDLDTVDRGVMEHLMPEIKKKDWHLIVAHLLGVDHCGHRYGPNHPEMARKLQEVNELVRSLVRAVEPDTLLVVMGDHGMTKSGDHGGDSTEEVEAGLFVYSARSFINKSRALATASIAQVDLVPTLSLLLGHPIPFSNLGHIVPSMFDPSPATANSLFVALKINADQILTFLRHYSTVSPDLSKDVLDRLEALRHRALDNQTLENWSEFFHDTFTSCQNVWAKFDMKGVLFGVMLVGTTVLGLLIILLLPVGIAFCSVGDWFSVFAVFVSVIHFFSMFSNSFQVHEDKMVACILQVLVCVHFLRTCQRVRPSIWLIARFVSLSILIRAMEMLRRCREEQSDCVASPFVANLDNDSSASYVFVSRIILSLALAAALFFWISILCWTRIHRTGRFNSGTAWMLLLVSVVLIIKPVFNKDPEIIQIYLPRCIYALALGIITHVVISPVFVFERTSSHVGKLPNHVSVEREYVGLESFFSISSVLIILPHIFVSVFLLGDIWSFVMVALLALARWHLTDPRPGNHVVTVVIWCFLAWQIFFSTGHQTTFPTLHWHSAFVGLRADSSQILHALLVIWETFSGQICMALAIPSVLLHGDGGTDVIWLETPHVFYRELWRGVLGYLLWHTTKLFFVMLNAAINRRHLMVWKIFAPRFMFESASFLVTCVAVILVYLYSLRVFSATHRFIAEEDVHLNHCSTKHKEKDVEKSLKKKR